MVGSGRLSPDLKRLNPKRTENGVTKCVGASRTPEKMRRLMETCIKYEYDQRPIFDERLNKINILAIKLIKLLCILRLRQRCSPSKEFLA